jgi:hypothetical protein
MSRSFLPQIEMGAMQTNKTKKQTKRSRNFVHQIERVTKRNGSNAKNSTKQTAGLPEAQTTFKTKDQKQSCSFQI